MNSYNPASDEVIEALIANVQRTRVDTHASDYHYHRYLRHHRHNIDNYIDNKLPNPFVTDFTRIREVEIQVTKAMFELEPQPSADELLATERLANAKLSMNNDISDLARRNLRILAVMENRDTNFEKRLEMIESIVDKALADIPDKRMEKIAEGYGEAARPKPGFMEKYSTPNLDPKTQIR